MERQNQFDFARFLDCLFPLAECLPRFIIPPLDVVVAGGGNIKCARSFTVS